jgi:anaerobic magnesium-protoporphyrin IX monomethyl ester cyclase
MVMKKVLLLVPPRTVDKRFLEITRIANIFPMGLMYIASVLENNKYEVGILDCLTERFEPQEVGNDSFRFGLSDGEIIDKIKKFDPDYIGVSCMFSTNYLDFVLLCRLIRSITNIPIVGGGPHVSADYENILNINAVDYVVIGEGEYVFLSLIEHLEYKLNIESLQGVASIDKGGKVKANLKLEYVDELDRLPFPAYHLVDFNKYYQAGHSHCDSLANTKWMPIITSRGCPCNCTFCYGTIMGGKKFRYRTTQNIIDEILYLKEHYSIDEIHIEDDNFCHNLERAIEILTRLTQMPIRLSFPNGLSLYSLNNDKLIQLLKLNDVLSLVVAIESGDDQILKDVMKKPVHTKLIKSVVNKLKENGISVKGFFILGMPGEKFETLSNTFNLIKDIKLDWNGFNIATPLPGTELAKICLENNYIDTKEFYEFSNINFARSIIDTPFLDHFQIEKYFYYFNIYFNFIEPIDGLTTEWEIDYKLFMYKRVKEIAPNHKFTDISYKRTDAIKELIFLKKDEENNSKRINELVELNNSLKQQQFDILNFELDLLRGKIVTFHDQNKY